MNYELHNGDCLDILQGMPDKSVDAVITDPPYGVRADDWDAMDEYEFARFSMAWMSQAKRISDTAIIFCTEGSVIERIAGMLYPRVRKAIWHKPLGSQYAGSSEAKLFFGFEVILHCYSGALKPKDLAFASILKAARMNAGLSRGAVDMAIRGKKTGLCYRWEEAACIPTPEQVRKLREILHLNGEFDAAIKASTEGKCDAAMGTDVFTYRTSTKGIHPCEKPEPLMVDILKTLGDGCGAALDPFMGSGSTGVACQAEGRKFIGIERDPKYFEIAKRRMEEAAKSQSLFATV